MILRQFNSLLEQIYLSKNISVTQWFDARPTARNILCLTKLSERKLLYVKVRSNPPGIWGLKKSRIEELESSEMGWGIILLVGLPEIGYYLSSHETKKQISSNEIRLAGDGNFKVHENRNVFLRPKITSIEGFADKILANLFAV